MLATSSAVMQPLSMDDRNASEKAFLAWVNALRLTPTSLIEWASAIEERVSRRKIQKGGYRATYLVGN